LAILAVTGQLAGDFLKVKQALPGSKEISDVKNARVSELEPITMVHRESVSTVQCAQKLTLLHGKNNGSQEMVRARFS
jgi:hypothetical protein